MIHSQNHGCDPLRIYENKNYSKAEFTNEKISFNMTQYFPIH